MERIIARRLEFEFDNEVEVEEEVEPPLNIVFVAHVLSKNETGDFECPICYESVPKKERVTISCRHDFCGKCTQDLLKTCCLDGKNATCPMCRYPCFLVETPDTTQFDELSELLDIIQEERDKANDQRDMNAFLYYHFIHNQQIGEEAYF